jgi:TRAP-type C4-dicarboxylate transport system permease small subunit
MPARLKKVLDSAEKVLTVASAVLLIALTVLVCVQVFARFVLTKLLLLVDRLFRTNTPPVNVFWTQEASLILMMWVGLLGAAGCIWTDGHMRLALVLERLPASVQLWVRVFIDLLVGLFSYFLFTQGIELVSQTMEATLSTVQFPMGVTYLVVPFAGAVMMLLSAMKALQRILDHYSKKKEAAHG